MINIIGNYIGYSQLGGEADQILLSEDFTGTVIDTTKGTITNPDSASLSISQNNKLIFKIISGGLVASPITNKWESVSSFNKLVVASVLLNHDVGFVNSLCTFRYAIDSNNFIAIQESSTALGTIRLMIQKDGGGFEYNNETGVSINKRVKMLYNASNEIKFYYWNTNQWTQLGTTQTLDIGNGGKVLLGTNSNTADSVNDAFSFDSLRVTNYEYTTELP